MFHETFYCSLSVDIVEEAKARYARQDASGSDREESVLYKLMQKDERYATVMAFDLIFGGIDTVNVSSDSMLFICLISVFIIDNVSRFNSDVLLSEES